MTDAASRHRVLVVDDEPLILSSLQRLLRREFDVLSAQSGSEGLDLLRTHDIHIIITDQRMPEMTGAEFLAHIRSAYPNPIPMLLTGYADIESVIAAINTGQVYRYLVKPWRPDELVAAVREAGAKYALLDQNRRLTQELIAANAELTRAARLKDEFLASMSHELRTPLNAVLGFAEALQEEAFGPLNDRQRQSLQHIATSGQRLLVLINDILDLAAIGAGKITLQLEPAALTPICQASMNQVTAHAQQKRLSITMTIDPALPLLTVDARRLQQVLVNLLSNAVKFTPEGGAIGLVVAADAARQFVELTVWDTGIGIAVDQIDHLFQPFLQLDGRRARQYEGTGLGLALVARLVELHGGSVGVTSEVGRGSRFTISLPWSQVQADAAGSGQAPH
jgi:signal transduction histidine kinase